MERKTIKFEIEQDWTAHELSQFIDSVDYYYTVFALAKYGNVERRSVIQDQSIDNDNTITPDNMYLLLEENQRLSVQEVQYASPGFISFEGLADVIKEVKEFIKDILTIPTALRNRHISEELNAKKNGMSLLI